MSSSGEITSMNVKQENHSFKAPLGAELHSNSTNFWEFTQGRIPIKSNNFRFCTPFCINLSPNTSYSDNTNTEPTIGLTMYFSGKCYWRIFVGNFRRNNFQLRKFKLCPVLEKLWVWMKNKKIPLRSPLGDEAPLGFLGTFGNSLR